MQNYLDLFCSDTQWGERALQVEQVKFRQNRSIRGTFILFQQVD